MANNIKPHEFQLSETLNSATISTVVPVADLRDGKELTRVAKAMGMQLPAQLEVCVLDDKREQLLAMSTWRVTTNRHVDRIVQDGMSEVHKNELVLALHQVSPWVTPKDGIFVPIDFDAQPVPQTEPKAEEPPKEKTKAA